MNTVNEIKLFLTRELNAAFRHYPVVIEESPEDADTLWVQVFSVPSPRVREVKNVIHNLQDEIGDKNGALLLPMVKNIEVTRLHYPQHAPCEISEIIAACGQIKTTKREKGYTLVGGLFYTTAENIVNGEYGIDYHLQQTPGEPFESLQPANLLGKAADTELSLAA